MKTLHSHQFSFKLMIFCTVHVQRLSRSLWMLHRGDVTGKVHPIFLDHWFRAVCTAKQCGAAKYCIMNRRFDCKTRGGWVKGQPEKKSGRGVQSQGFGCNLEWTAELQRRPAALWWPTQGSFPLRSCILLWSPFASFAFLSSLLFSSLFSKFRYAILLCFRWEQIGRYGDTPTKTKVREILNFSRQVNINQWNLNTTSEPLIIGAFFQSNDLIPNQQHNTRKMIQTYCWRWVPPLARSKCACTGSQTVNRPTLAESSGSHECLQHEYCACSHERSMALILRSYQPDRGWCYV